MKTDVRLLFSVVGTFSVYKKMALQNEEREK
jgi:hypothetical protein